MIAQRVLGATLIYQGELAQGLENLKQAIALYNPQRHRPLAFVYGQDIGVICKQWSAWALWLLGYPDQALKMNLETIQMAQEVCHPLTLAYVLWLSAMFYQFRRQRKQAKELAEQALRLSTDQGFVIFLTASVIVLGMLAEEGEIEEGIARTREGIAAFRATGAELFLPYHLARVADAYRRVGQTEEGLAALAEALVIGKRSGEHAWDAEVYRIKGELMLIQGADESEAEACFHQALEVARRQGAKSYELRTAVSLTRLLKRQGKTEKARTLLSEIYGWFTEGFDTADLQEAKALLKELT
jgi:predicted ATPase